MWAHVYAIGLLVLPERSLAPLHPLFYDFAMNVDKNEAQVFFVVGGVFLLLVLVEFLLDWLLQIRILVLKVRDQLLDLVITLLERELHDIDDLVSSQSCGVLAPEHLLGAEFPLVNLCDFTEGNNHCRLLREATEGQVVLVDKETAPVEH